MNIPVRHATAATKLAIVDCDIHPAFRKPSDLYPFLPARWREHMTTFGEHLRQGLSGQLAWPRMMASGLRVDAFPEDGPPGSDLELMRRQHLDANGVEYGMLMQLSKGGMEERNLEFAAALSHAINDWQLETFVKPEPRLRAGIVVPQEDAAFAVKRDRAPRRAIRRLRRSSSRRGRAIRSATGATGRSTRPRSAATGRSRCTSRASAAAMPRPASGWPTYYMEEHYAATTGMQNTLTSLVFEGVFERFPKLKIVLIEGGFAWAPALCWRMDKHWERLRVETPHVKRPPSEYVREHVWFTTQPIEEPDHPQHLAEVIEWLGWDRLMFSTDYPHWDFDDPQQAFKFKMTEAQKAKVFRDNAKALYGLP